MEKAPTIFPLLCWSLTTSSLSTPPLLQASAPVPTHSNSSTVATHPLLSALLDSVPSQVSFWRQEFVERSLAPGSTSWMETS